MPAIDEFLPSPEVVSRHSIRVAAPPERVLAAVRTADFGEPWVVRLLMGLRMVPVAVAHPRETWRRFGRSSRPRAAEHSLGPRFTVLADRPDELVLGLQGRFWTATGGLVPVDAATFAAGPPRGLAQAVWNFRVEPEGDGTRLLTETRVRTGDPDTARRFLRYWRVIGPFSGLIRNRLLALVRRRAESAEPGRRIGTAAVEGTTGP